MWIVSIIFMSYFGVMISMIVESQLEPKNELYPISDIVLLVLIPMLGFYFSKKSFKYLTEDSYTQMMIYLRTLPISSKVIMGYRYMQLTTALIINSLIFFSIMYGISHPLRVEMPLEAFISFALTWIGYAIAVMGIYIHFEFLCSGRKYFWLSMILMGISFIVAIAIRMLGGNLLLYTVNMSQEWGMLSPVMWGTLVGGLIVLAIMGKFTIRKLQNRDLL
ncbi:hypothetical protein LPB68_09420 [Paenibacillus crassostreae]|nr:hypothetical protein LPB68_09420 [Paenibacillus crassostreae]